MSTRWVSIALIALALAAAATTAWDDTGSIASEFDAAERRKILQHASKGPPPPAETNRVADDPDAAKLGQALFFDPRLSANGEVSCATCHDPARGFADGRPLAEGMGTGRRHTLSLWNVAYNRWFFWDGRADSLWSQALQPIERPEELGSTRLHAVNLVHGDAALRASYERTFGPLPDPTDPATVDAVFANIGKAIAAYERRLVARNSPFDRFVEGLRDGDEAAMAALSPAARRGLRLFVGQGECRLCHSGPQFSDGEFHDVRVPPRGGGTATDSGRYEGVRLLKANPFNAMGGFSDDREGRTARRSKFVAGGPESWGSFKTPSLRNVKLTAPYMHQGQFETLEDVVRYYSTLEGALASDHHDETILVPRNFTEAQMADLIAFLEALTDTGIDPSLLAPP